MTDIPDEAEFVIDILKGQGKMTTKELEKEIKNLGIACNDAASKFLPGLKSQDYIKGEFKNRTWHWWVDEQTEG